MLSINYLSLALPLPHIPIRMQSIYNPLSSQTNTLEQTLTMKIRPQLVELADIFDRPISNQTALQQLLNALNVVQGNVTLATNAAGDIRRPLMGISMNSFLTVSFVKSVNCEKWADPRQTITTKFNWDYT